MSQSLIIGYGVVFDKDGRVMLLRRRADESLWPGQWWLPGDVTPLDEEPDDTVPRLFEHLLRQRVRATYVHTVYGEEPSSGRHSVHNAYLVTVEESLDGASKDETNPFDAMEWWDVRSAVAELPDQQAELLSLVVERRESGWDFGVDSTLDDLFGEPTSPPVVAPPSATAVPPRVLALTRMVARIAASNALGQDVEWEEEWLAAHSHGWTMVELDQIGLLAAELGRSASLECAPTVDENQSRGDAR